MDVIRLIRSIANFSLKNGKNTVPEFHGNTLY